MIYYGVGYDIVEKAFYDVFAFTTLTILVCLSILTTKLFVGFVSKGPKERISNRHFPTKLFIAFLMIFLMLPYFYMHALDVLFVKGDYSETIVEYEPTAVYYKTEIEHHVALFDGPLGVYMCSYEHPIPLGKSGVLFIFSIDDFLYNVRKITVNLSFSDSQTSYKYFTNIRFGYGVANVEFYPVKTADERLFKDTGREVVFSFDLKDYIQNRNVSANAFCVDFQMNDDGEPINYFDAGDSITIRVRVYVTDAWKYYDGFKVLMLMTDAGIIILTIVVLFARITPEEMIF